MTYAAHHLDHEPTRADVDAMTGVTLLEFGAPWCPHCLAVQDSLRTVLNTHGDARHLKIEDGRGKPLGRSYRVKLWPTLILLRDGMEHARAVRPTTIAEIEALWDASAETANAERTHGEA